MKKLLFTLFLLPLLATANIAIASEEVHLDEAPIDANNHASLQRGARTFVNYCLNCHSANYMRYNRLLDIGLTEKQIKDNFLVDGQKIGDTMKISMNPKDAKQWFGAAPPDLSVEVRARGADWVYTYLRGFYRDETRPTGWNNTVYDKVAMPHILYELQGEQVLNEKTHALKIAKPGSLSDEAYDELIADLTNYLAYMAEPAKAQRNRMGWFVLLFLGVLLVLTYKLKKAYWKDIH